MSGDESLHVAHAVMLYGKLEKRVSKKRFIEIMKEAVDIEIEFITEAIPCRLIGTNSVLMISYIKFIADRLALQLGYYKIYGDKNPLDFMEMISIDQKKNILPGLCLSNEYISRDESLHVAHMRLCSMGNWRNGFPRNDLSRL